MNSFESNKAIKITDKELYDIHVKRLQRIFDIAYLNGIKKEYGHKRLTEIIEDKPKCILKRLFRK